MADELDLDSAVCFTLYSTSNAVMAAYREVLAPLGLSYQQYVLICLLQAKGPLTVSGIAEELFLDTASASGLVTRLEKLGHVQKRRGNEDQRVVTVHLGEGLEALRPGLDAVQPRVRAAMGITQAQAEHLVDTVGSLRTHLIASGPHPETKRAAHGA